MLFRLTHSQSYSNRVYPGPRLTKIYLLLNGIRHLPFRQTLCSARGGIAKPIRLIVAVANPPRTGFSNSLLLLDKYLINDEISIMPIDTRGTRVVLGHKTNSNCGSLRRNKKNCKERMHLYVVHVRRPLV